MKTKIMIIALTILFAFTSLAFSGQKQKKHRKQQGNQQRQKYDNRGGGHKQPQRYDTRRHHENRRWNKGHRQGHHRHIPDYRQHRHWKRWSDWDRHYRHNHHRYEGGRYYNDNRGNLMFKHCQDDRDSSTCISFGIYF